MFHQHVFGCNPLLRVIQYAGIFLLPLGKCCFYVVVTFAR